jgi:anti-sigma regulatory factor (Ser/Thr protein kinase)
MLLYDDDRQLLDAAVPFLREGIEAGEPTVLCVGDERRQLIVDALGPTAGLTELPMWHGRAAFATLRSNRDLFAEHKRDGAERIRLLGEVPYRSDDSTWGSWIRYEAAINHLYADLPVSMLCPYDRRIAGVDLLDDIASSHPTLAASDAAADNPEFVGPEALLLDLAHRDIDPIEATSADIQLADPRPAAARLAVGALAATTLVDTAIEDLVLAVGEVVANAVQYGVPPVVVRAWATDDRVVVTVEDSGAGPDDPFAGMVPGPSAPNGGLGLHIVYQVCTLVTMTRGPGAFTVHLTMTDGGRAPAPGVFA